MNLIYKTSSKSESNQTGHYDWIYLDILYHFMYRYIMFEGPETFCWRTEKQHSAFIEDHETS